MLRARLWMLLYQAATWLALLTTVALLPLLSWARPKFSKWFRMRFWPEPIAFQPCLWIHAVSMGEVNIALALLNALPRAMRGETLLTTSTQTGHRILIEKLGRQRVRYLPWDVRPCYRRLFGERRVPDLLVVETEIWPGLFAWIASNQARLAIVNGRLSAKTMRLRRNPLFRRAFGQATHILARSERDSQLFAAFGVPADRISVTGNIKFDFKPVALADGPFSRWLADAGSLAIFASISTDEAVPLAAQAAVLKERLPRLKLLWAPRHLQDLEKHLAALRALRPRLRSALATEDDAGVVVLDTFGELSGCYAFADVSLVGGSFNARGGQNFLESLQAGAPVVLGPSAENFQREVEEALAEQVVVQAASDLEVADRMAALLADREGLRAMSERARSFLAKHTGAVARTVEKLIDLGVIQR